MAEIKILTKSASKADEIKWIETVAGLVQTGTYLESFFQKDLVTWVCEQIKNDFPPEIWEYYRGEIEENGNARVAVQEMETRLASAKSANAQLNENYQKLQEQINGVSASLRTANEKIQELVTKNFYAEETHEKEIEAQAAEIMKLKAMIFDLEHK